MGYWFLKWVIDWLTDWVVCLLNIKLNYLKNDYLTGAWLVARLPVGECKRVALLPD